MEYFFAVYSVFSFSHSKVDILLQTQCLSLNFDAKRYSSAVRSQNEIEQPLPQSSSRSVYACTNIIFLRMYQEKHSDYNKGYN